MGPLSLFAHYSTRDCASLTEETTAVHRRAVDLMTSAHRDMDDYLGLRHLLQPVLQHSYWHAVGTLGAIQAELLATAHPPASA